MGDLGAPSKVQVAVALLRTAAGGVQASCFDRGETVVRMEIADKSAGLL